MVAKKTKDATGSLTIWGALIMVFDYALTSAGYSPLPPGLAQDIPEIIGLIMIVIGRMKTTITPIATMFNIKLPWVKS